MYSHSHLIFFLSLSRSVFVWPRWMLSWSLPSNPAPQGNSYLTRCVCVCVNFLLIQFVWFFYSFSFGSTAHIEVLLIQHPVPQKHALNVFWVAVYISHSVWADILAGSGNLRPWQRSCVCVFRLRAGNPSCEGIIPSSTLPLSDSASSSGCNSVQSPLPHS